MLSSHRYLGRRGMEGGGRGGGGGGGEREGGER